MESKDKTSSDSRATDQENIDTRDIIVEDDGEEPKSTQTKKGTSSFINKCPSCGATVTDVTDLGLHIRKTKCKIDHCPSCNKPVKGLKGLGGHVTACPENPEYQKKLKEKEDKKNKIENSRETITKDRRDIMDAEEEPQSKSLTAGKSGIVRADAGKLRGKVMQLLKRYRVLPDEEKSDLMSDYEVLRDYRKDLKLKRDLDSELIEEMEMELEDIEENIVESEDVVKKKVKPDDLEKNSGKIDYHKKLDEMDKKEEEEYDREVYRRRQEIKLRNLDQGLPMNQGMRGKKDNGNQEGYVDYQTLDGGQIKILNSEAIELEKEKIKVNLQLDREKHKKDQDDPYVDYAEMQEGKWTGKVHKMRQTTRDQLMFADKIGTQGRGSEVTDQLKAFQDQALGEINRLREEMNEEKVGKRLDKIENAVYSLASRDETEQYLAWKEKLQRVGALGETPDMAELKHIHQMEGDKFGQAAGMMNKTQANLGNIATRGMDMIETIALDKRKKDSQSSTTEPMVDGMTEMRVNYPPGGQPLPPTHNHTKQTMTYRDYIEEIPTQQQQQTDTQPQQKMTYQQYVPDYAGPPPQPTNPPPPPQQQYQQPPQQPIPQPAPPPQQQYQQPPPQPIPQPDQPTQQIPLPQQGNLQGQKLTYKDMIPDDIIIRTKEQAKPQKTEKSIVKKAS